MLAGTDTNLASAPPVAPVSAPAYAVGAHQGHLNPSAASALMPPVRCAECHAVPGDAVHATNPPAQKVVFGTLATTGGAAPTWDATGTGCAASYCHGNFQFGKVTGANATPLWTDTASLACSSCHAMPPAGHPALLAAVTAAACSACHAQAVNPDGTINLAGGAHMNGKSDVLVKGCTGCHGDPSRIGNLPGTDANLTSAPPQAPASAPANAVGDHLGHLNPTSAGAMAAPVACSECHVAFVDAAHANNPPAQRVTFGALATTGGAAPTWDSAGRAARPPTATATSSSITSPGQAPRRSGPTRRLSPVPPATECRPPVTRRSPEASPPRPATPAIRSR